jgi:PAS domain S-box-containing protein
MKRTSDLKLIIFFTALTFLLTAAVVLAWEKWLLPPFYSWVDTHYPGEANIEVRWKIQQRVEHFFISVAVDMVVVTLLLRVVRRQHQKAAASEARYRALFEHAEVGFAFFNTDDGRVIESNQKLGEILGAAPQEFVGREVSELLRPHEAATGAQTIALLPPTTGELTVRRAGGEPLPLSISFDSFPTGGEHLGLLIARDLTESRRHEAEREEMRRQLYQSSKLASVGELAAGVAHEINNPLNGVINFAQLLKDESTGRTEFERQMIDGILDEGARIARIVRDLLTFARHDAHELYEVSVEEMIRTSLSLFGRQLEKDGIEVEVEIEPSLPPVRADGSRLRQVVVNMISNAYHALRAKPAGERKLFRVSARSAQKEGGHVVLEFFDTGVGVRSADINRLFDPFFTTRRDAGGTGLGLSISFGIIRDHGGTIRVESEEGHYTRFIVELPTTAPLPAPETNAHA